MNEQTDVEKLLICSLEILCALVKGDSEGTPLRISHIGKYSTMDVIVMNRLVVNL